MSIELPMLPLASTVAGSGQAHKVNSSQIDDDWSFASLKPSKTSWGPHGYHRYPAKFIPQLVRRLIDTYSLPGDLIGDTFVGSAYAGYLDHLSKIDSRERNGVSSILLTCKQIETQ